MVFLPFGAVRMHVLEAIPVDCGPSRVASAGNDEARMARNGHFSVIRFTSLN